MLFFTFLLSMIPISFAEEENDGLLWKKTALLESEYFIHFQAQVRNIDGSLDSVIETFNGQYLLDSKTELAYSKLPLKKIVEFSNQKYEMKQVKLVEKNLLVPTDYLSVFSIGFDIDGSHITVFHAYPPYFVIENSDIMTTQWTILKKI